MITVLLAFHVLLRVEEEDRALEMSRFLLEMFFKQAGRVHVTCLIPMLLIVFLKSMYESSMPSQLFTAHAIFASELELCVSKEEKFCADV